MNGFPSTSSRIASIGDDLRDIAKRLDALCAKSHSLADAINAVPGQEFLSDMARDFDVLARAYGLVPAPVEHFAGAAP